MEAATVHQLHPTGEIPADGPQSMGEALALIADLEDVLAERDTTLRSLEGKLRKLKRDRRAEAEGHADWPVIEALFRVWQKLANKSRSKFDWKRFELAHPFYVSDGYEVCLQAIVGRTYEAFSTTRTNGSVRVFNEWERIFDGRKEFEESANRRPSDWRDRVLAVGERTTVA